MDTSEQLMFTPVEFDPDNPSIHRRRFSSRYNPYIRSAPSSTSLASASVIDDTESARCTTDLPDPQSKCSLKDYDKTQQLALYWAQKRLVMDGATTGWIRNNTKDEKAKMATRVMEIIFQASIKFGCELTANSYTKDFVAQALTQDRRRLATMGEGFVHLHKLEPLPTESEKARKIYMNKRREVIYDARQPFEYYLHGIEETETSTNVLIFAGESVEETHIKHWYESKKSPLWDEEMRSSIHTTPLDMLAETATAVRCAIDRHIEGRLTGSNPMPFATSVYAQEQQLIKDAMVFALQQDLHRESFQRRLLNLHHRGLQRLYQALGLPVPPIPIHVPLTTAELSRPHPVPSHNTMTALPGPSTLSPFVEMDSQVPLIAEEPQMTFAQMSNDVGLNLWGFPDFGLDLEQPRPELEGPGSNEMPFSI